MLGDSVQAGPSSYTFSYINWSLWTYTPQTHSTSLFLNYRFKIEHRIRGPTYCYNSSKLDSKEMLGMAI